MQPEGCLQSGALAVAGPGTSSEVVNLVDRRAVEPDSQVPLRRDEAAGCAYAGLGLGREVLCERSQFVAAKNGPLSPPGARARLRPHLGSAIRNSPSPGFVSFQPTRALNRMHLLPREIGKVLLHNVGSLAQKRLARGVRLNLTEATALIATVLHELIRDGNHSVAELMAIGKLSHQFRVVGWLIGTN